MKRFYSLILRECRRSLPTVAIISGAAVALPLVFLLFQVPAGSFWNNETLVSVFARGITNPVEEFRGVLVEVRAPAPIAVEVQGEEVDFSKLPEAMRTKARQMFQEAYLETRRKLVPQSWTPEQENQGVTIFVNAREVKRMANRIVIHRPEEKGIHDLEIWKGGERVYYNAHTTFLHSRLKEFLLSNPRVISSLTVASLQTGFMVLVLLLAGFLLASLYQLASSLGAERREGTTPFLKTLPVGDVSVSLSKGAAAVLPSALWTAALILAVDVLLAVLLPLGAGIRMSVSASLVWFITERAFTTFAGARFPDMYTLVNYYFLFFAFSGLFFLAGSVLSRHAFLVCIFFVLGLLILTAATASLVPDMMVFLQSFLAAGDRTFWLATSAFNILCVSAATLVYSRREVA